ncbi:hypothetical protein FG05_08268 [Fusarium graminearum]|nr:hypothetical protein FG05_08268 [Fusarium graminearum]
MNGLDAPQRHFITLCIVIEAFITYVREASLTASEAAWHGSRPNEMRRDEVQPRSDKLMQDPQNPPRRLTPRLRKVQGLVEGQAVHYEILWVSSAIVTMTFSFLTNINEINPPASLGRWSHPFAWWCRCHHWRLLVMKKSLRAAGTNGRNRRRLLAKPMGP